MGKKSIIKRVTISEALAFGIVCALIWVNEIFDIPHNIFGTVATPINWSEALIESAYVLILAVIMIAVTRHYMKQVTILEGMLPICSYCKKIQHGDEWVQIEAYVRKHTEAEFTHGICPDCMKKQFSDYQ